MRANAKPGSTISSRAAVTITKTHRLIAVRAPLNTNTSGALRYATLHMSSRTGP